MRGLIQRLEEEYGVVVSIEKISRASDGRRRVVIKKGTYYNGMFSIKREDVVSQ